MPTKNFSKKKIEQLTPEQEHRLVEWRNEWLAIGRATGPVDREATKAVFVEFYKRLNLPAPIVWWCQSPFQAAVYGGLFESLPVDSAAVANLRANLGDNLGANLWANLRDNLRDNLGANLRANLWANLWDNLGDKLQQQVNRFFWGQHEASWVAHYAFCRDVVGLEYNADNSKLLNLWATLCKSGWWQARKGIVLACERPTLLSINDEGRLHNESGPAMQFSDTYSLWAVGGVRVDEQIVMKPETQSLEQIEKEENAEVRRVRIERFGWPRYLAESGAKVAHSRLNERDGQSETLYKLKDKTKRFVCVDPSTGRKYALGVPAKIKNCDEAQNWMSHGLDRFAVHRS